MFLEGYWGLDCTVWQHGPVASVMLGDLGAEVIKIEERETGDPARGVIFWPTGQIAGMIKELKSAKQIVHELVDGAVRVLQDELPTVVSKGL